MSDPTQVPRRRVDLSEEAGWVVGALLALSLFWVPFVLAGVWMTTAWKHRFDVDVEASLPTDSGRARDLLIVIGLPCIAAAVVAVVLNLVGRRSRIADVVAYVSAAIAAVSGALIWAWPSHVSCDKTIGVLTKAGPVNCPGEYLHAANGVINTIDWAGAGLVFIGAVAAIATTWSAHRQQASHET